ncbi:MAG: hypothetical protein WAO98_04185 [Alphaproteobacteria bacterium]
MLFASNKDGKISVTQVLVPVGIVSFVLFIMLSFQMSQILRDRQNLQAAHMNQSKAFEEAQKVQTQLDALAVGTQKLAGKGNKNAKAIIDRMKKLGITVNDNAALPAPAADAPAPAKAPAKTK